MTGLNDFSIIAAENSTAAAPIFWSEGMPANAVNDSAREVMAALARWNLDNRGSLGGTITNNAVSVTSYQGVKESHFGAGFRISFALTQANTGPVTLNIDNTGARPWRRPRGSEFAPGDIAALVVHEVVWLPVLNYFVSVAPSFDAPGQIAAFALAEAIPPGWVECDGRAVSRSAYAALFGAIGPFYGSGDGSTTFNVPDLNGRALYGRDSGKGRLTGAGGLAGGLGSVGGAESVSLTEGQLPSHSHGGSTGSAGLHDHGGSTAQAGQHNHGGSTSNAGGHNHNGTTGGAGAHNHGGTTQNAGNHVHSQNYERLSIYGGGGSLSAVSQLFPPGNNSTATSESAGVHQHTFTTDQVGEHSHNFTTSGVGDHAHSISADGTHFHAITGDGSHTHSLSIATTGGGQGHPNMPPGLVAVYAIKA